MTSISKKNTKIRASIGDAAARDSEGAHPMRFARTVAKEYTAMENGYHAKLHEFLRRAYHSYQLFLEFPEGFEELKRHPFWENSRQKPKVLNTSKWVLYFLMRATQSNHRARASKYAKILDELDREGVHVTKAAKRIAELGGVEATYKWMVAAEEGPAVSGAEGGDEEMESEGCSISGKLPASREVDAKAHGEPISPTETNIERAVGNGRSIPSFDPERSLIVELEGADLERVLDAGDAAEGPARLRLEITVHPRNVEGFARVVGRRISSVGKPVNEPLPKGSAGRRTPRGPGLPRRLLGKSRPPGHSKKERRTFGRGVKG